jgi:hypothetical protein
LTWTLTDLAGTVINNREAEVISAPAASNDILLSGDDLAFQSSESSKTRVGRKLLVEGTCASSLGSDLPVKDEVQFTIRNLLKVT